MITRILGEGQFDVDEDRLSELNVLDEALQAAIDSGQEAAFDTSLRALLDAARRFGTPLPETTLTGSELVLPAQDSTLEQVRALLGDEGLIPG
ncbi:MAG TPA: hypothetical protein VFG87_19295 [Amycolatopsis sp.]|jgi:hypothetical protein|nr:hypothetical protein [Amycolatopsis sp.]